MTRADPLLDPMRAICATETAALAAAWRCTMAEAEEQKRANAQCLLLYVGVGELATYQKIAAANDAAPIGKGAA